MLHNIYTALSGSLAQERALEIITNNLANAETLGFKEEQVTFKRLDPEPESHYNSEPLPPANYKIPFETLLPLKGNEMSYVGISGIAKNFQQGTVLETQNPLDLMIEGEGFFSLHTPQGLRYTRNGAFSLGEGGVLVDKQGAPVLGERGLLYLDGGKKISISPQGDVYQEDLFIDKLVLMEAKDKKAWEALGDSHWAYRGEEEDGGLIKVENPKVSQGYLEGSNVNLVKNLTQLIVAQRSFEAYQKAIQNFDNMLETSNSRLGVSRT